MTRIVRRRRSAYRVWRARVAVPSVSQPRTVSSPASQLSRRGGSAGTMAVDDAQPACQVDDTAECQILPLCRAFRARDFSTALVHGSLSRI